MVTLVVPLPPSTTATSSAEMTGCGSSVAIVPVAAALSISMLTGLLSATVNVSSGSYSVSPVTATVIVFCVSPAAKGRVPLAATKSAVPAVPGFVVQATLAGDVGAGLSVTVKLALTVPLSPSVTRTSAMTARDGTSSALIVTVAGAGGTTIAPPPGVERVTVKVLFPSSTVSCRIGIAIDFDVSPGPNVSVLLVAV